MISVAVINLKTLIKKCAKMLLILVFLIIFIKCIKLAYDFVINVNFEKVKLNNDIEIIKNNINIAKCFDNEAKKNSNIKKILVAELAVFSGVEEELMEKENQEEILEFDNIDKKENYIEELKQEERKQEDINSEQEDSIIPVDTKVIQEKNKKDVYTDIYQTVKIKNESKYVLTEDMVKPDFDYLNKKDIIIYHTHTCESYTPTENSNYIPTGNYRTTDMNYSVVRVGSELTDCMKNKGYNIIHNVTYHDYPAYTGSYTRSLSTIQSLLDMYNTVDCIFDIHRDALGNNSDYGPCVQIGEEKVAQLMFVIGTDGGGLEHPKWNNNLKLAIKIQEEANKMYPGLFKPIILRNSRYNQHIANGAAIIEVGATGNTIEECIGSMRYLANVLDYVMKK